MLQKLKPYICLAALLMLGTGVLFAQSGGFPEPGSMTGDATYGRFGTDVDNFLSVNDWADLSFSKWFGYLKMGPVNLNAPNNDFFKDWETGFALKTAGSYLSFFYNGTFSSGSTVVKSDNDGVTKIGPDLWEFLASGTWGSGFTAPTPVVHNNNFGVLIGTGSSGIRFTVSQALTTMDLEYVTVSNDIVFSQVFGPAAAGKVDFTIPQGSVGNYKNRAGNITPEFLWGAARDMNLGKYTSRPSAGMRLAVHYADSAYNLTRSDGSVIDIPEEWQDYLYTGNWIAPTLIFNTGGIKFFSGDWGAISAGVAEEFSFRINGSGKNTVYPRPGKPIPGDETIFWENQLTPYASFSYKAADYLSVGAKLTVPMWFGYKDANESFFGIGAKGDAVTGPSSGPDRGDYLPTFKTGFQLNGAFFDKLMAKYGVFDRLTLNWGIKAYLPGYLYSGTYEYNDDDPTGTKFANIKTRNYIVGDNGTFLQMMSFGLTFNITPKVMIDISVGENETAFNETTMRILFSAKH